MPKDTNPSATASKNGDPTHLGGDRWKIRVYAGLDPTGKQRQRSATFKANGIAEARREARRHRLAIEDQIKEGAQWKGTLGELAEEWMQAKASRHADTTRYANRVMVNRIVKDIGRIRLEKLTAKDLDRFYGTLMDGGLSASTANHYHRILHAILRQGHKWGSVPGNVADLASPPSKASGIELGMPTPAALRSLIDSDRCSHNLRMAALIAAATGCRRGEVVGLMWSDIDGNKLRVRRAIIEVPGQPLKVKAPKSGKGREMKLDPDFLGELLEHHMWLAGECAKAGGVLRADGPILASLSPLVRGRSVDPNGGEPFTPSWLTRKWIDLCATANVDFRFHSLRHFHASELIGRGIAPSTVSKRMGHSKVSTTLDIYTQALPAGDDDAAAAIGDAMRPTVSNR